MGEVILSMLEAMKAADRQQGAYRRCTYCYKAQLLYNPASVFALMKE